MMIEAVGGGCGCPARWPFWNRSGWEFCRRATQPVIGEADAADIDRLMPVAADNRGECGPVGLCSELLGAGRFTLWARVRAGADLGTVIVVLTCWAEQRMVFLCLRLAVISDVAGLLVDGPAGLYSARRVSRMDPFDVLRQS